MWVDWIQKGVESFEEEEDLKVSEQTVVWVLITGLLYFPSFTGKVILLAHNLALITKHHSIHLTSEVFDLWEKLLKEVPLMFFSSQTLNTWPLPLKIRNNRLGLEKTRQKGTFHHLFLLREKEQLGSGQRMCPFWIFQRETSIRIFSQDSYKDKLKCFEFYLFFSTSSSVFFSVWNEGKHRESDMDVLMFFWLPWEVSTRYCIVGGRGGSCYDVCDNESQVVIHTLSPPIASNTFSSWTRSCWMLFIRIHAWQTIINETHWTKVMNERARKNSTLEYEGIV